MNPTTDPHALLKRIAELEAELERLRGPHRWGHWRYDRELNAFAHGSGPDELRLDFSVAQFFVQVLSRLSPDDIADLRVAVDHVRGRKA